MKILRRHVIMLTKYQRKHCGISLIAYYDTAYDKALRKAAERN